MSTEAATLYLAFIIRNLFNSSWNFRVKSGGSELCLWNWNLLVSIRVPWYQI